MNIYNILWWNRTLPWVSFQSTHLVYMRSIHFFPNRMYSIFTQSSVRRFQKEYGVIYGFPMENFQNLELSDDCRRMWVTRSRVHIVEIMMMMIERDNIKIRVNSNICVCLNKNNFQSVSISIWLHIHIPASFLRIKI